MNRIFKVVFNHVLGRHVVVSEVARAIQRGACKAVAVVLTAGAALAVSGNALAGSPYLAPDQSAVSNNSGLDVYTVPGTTHQYTGENAGIDIELTQKQQTAPMLSSLVLPIWGPISRVGK
ncbi:MAG: ESPR domain-containing protein [Oxalobacter sp.]|nr:ESPR domain-containing protein [Oxalobacter sp.]